MPKKIWIQHMQQYKCVYKACSMGALHTWCWVPLSLSLSLRVCMCAHIWCLNQSCASTKRVHALRVRLHVAALCFMRSPSRFLLSVSFALHRRSIVCHERWIRTKSKRRARGNNKNGCNVSAPKWRIMRWLFATLFVFIWNVIIFPWLQTMMSHVLVDLLWLVRRQTISFPPSLFFAMHMHTITCLHIKYVFMMSLRTHGPYEFKIYFIRK